MHHLPPSLAAVMHQQKPCRHAIPTITASCRSSILRARSNVFLSQSGSREESRASTALPSRTGTSFPRVVHPGRSSMVEGVSCSSRKTARDVIAEGRTAMRGRRRYTTNTYFFLIMWTNTTTNQPIKNNGVNKKSSLNEPSLLPTSHSFRAHSTYLLHGTRDKPTGTNFYFGEEASVKLKEWGERSREMRNWRRRPLRHFVRTYSTAEHVKKKYLPASSNYVLNNTPNTTLTLSTQALPRLPRTALFRPVSTKSPMLNFNANLPRGLRPLPPCCALKADSLCYQATCLLPSTFSDCYSRVWQR